jgi:hypothetical protein
MAELMTIDGAQKEVKRPLLEAAARFCVGTSINSRRAAGG